ncbi:MAG TPA: flagellar biosynthetic protein FliQ [Terriglobales bacterium]|nr:flagellar biosynthetic protein FliQ [Terriglobales bacterium]
MDTAQTIALLRNTLEVAFFLAAPLLLIATAVSLLVNVAQVLTSLQDQTISSVPRLFAIAVASLLLLPWMLRRLVAFTVVIWGDFHLLAR